MKTGLAKNRAVLSSLAIIAVAALAAVSGITDRDGMTGHFIAGGTFQPGSDGKDTYIVSGSPNQNFGASVDMDIKGDDNRRVLMEFDLSGIPADAIIKTATLTLYVTGTGAPPNPVINVSRINTTWEEGTGTGSITNDGATWNNASGAKRWTTSGGDFDPTVWATTTITGANQYYGWDVTELVRSWTNGTYTNYGLLIRTATANSGITTFASSDNANASIRPNLTITYVTPSLWSNQDQNASTLASGDAINLSVFWDDNSMLKYAWLTTNESGGWENKTSYGSPMLINAASGWSNFSWQNDSISGGTIVGWGVYANNSDGLENATSIMTFTITAIQDNAPAWSNVQNSIPDIYSDTTASVFSVTWTDDTGVSIALFESNYSGTSTNYTMSIQGPDIYSFSAIPPAGTFYWMSHANDTGGKSNSTPQSVFTIDRAALPHSEPEGGIKGSSWISPNQPSTCPTCPPSTDWSACSDGRRTRTVYECDGTTGYSCLPRTDESACEGPVTPPSQQPAQNVTAPTPITGPLASIIGPISAIPGLMQIIGIAAALGGQS